jgi:hypothetical protein
MTRPLHVAREHELEPQYGLPEPLPADEKILWQGSPDTWALARSAFHVGVLAVYFSALLAWQVADLVGSGAPLAAWPRALAVTLMVSGIGLSLVMLLAWLSARTTVYTLTTQRVVMRIGIVLTVAFNLPLKRIEAAQFHPLRRMGKGTGDIALSLESETRIAWLQLWPHARPWRVARPQPLLRALPQAEEVCRLLTEAWVAVNGQPAAPERTPAAAARTPTANVSSPSWQAATP